MVMLLMDSWCWMVSELVVPAVRVMGRDTLAVFAATVTVLVWLEAEDLTVMLPLAELVEAKVTDSV